MGTKWPVVVGMACTLALLVSACGSGGGGDGAKANASATQAPLSSGGTLTELIPSDPGNLDPLKTVNTVTRQMDFFLYDSLVNEEENGRIVSGLAASWHPTAHGGETFILHRDIRCSDGSTLSAATVAANIDYMANPKNASPLLGVYIPVGTRATFDNAAGSVTLSFSQPAPFVMQGLSQAGLVCAKGLANPSLLANSSDGTGPYEVSSAVAGSQYDLTVHHGYDWGPGGASTDVAGIPAKLVVKVVASPTTQASLLLENQANIASVIGLADKPLRAASLFSQTATGPLGELWFNEQTGHPGASEAVRRALVEALDLPQVGSVYGQDQGQTPTGLVSILPKPCSGNTVAGNLPAYNPAGARALLTQAGWAVGAGGIRTKGGKPLSLTLYYPSDAGGDPTSAYELVAQEWGKVGVKVTLVSDTSVALEGVVLGTSGNWDAANVPLGIDSPTQAVPFAEGPSAPKGENFAHIDDPTYTSLVTSASSKSGTTGCPAWNRAEVSLFHDVDIVPFENESVPTFGKSVTFTQAVGNIFATSLRLRRG